jgi:hypothetical protein
MTWQNDKNFVCNENLFKMSIDGWLLSVDNLSVDNLSVDNLSVDNLSVDNLSVDKLSVDKVVCRQNDCLQNIYTQYFCDNYASYNKFLFYSCFFFQKASFYSFKKVFAID